MKKYKLTNCSSNNGTHNLIDELIEANYKNATSIIELKYKVAKLERMLAKKIKKFERKEAKQWK